MPKERNRSYETRPAPRLDKEGELQLLIDLAAARIRLRQELGDDNAFERFLALRAQDQRRYLVALSGRTGREGRPIKALNDTDWLAEYEGWRDARAGELPKTELATIREFLTTTDSRYQRQPGAPIGENDVRRFRDALVRARSAKTSK